MKKILIPILMLVIFSSPNAFAEEYKNYQNHYTLTIPEGWLPITSEEILKIEEDANTSLSTNNSARVNYIAGYRDYKNQSGWLLIQEHSVTTSIEKWMEGMSQSFRSEDINNPNFKLLEQGIDPELNTYYVNAEITMGNEIISMNSFLFSGKTKSTQLNYYSTKKGLGENLSKILTSAQSFSYEDGYEYQESKNITEGSTEAAAGGSISGGFIVLLLGGIVWIISLFTRKNKGK